jgi:hypothetical protein
MLCSKPCSNHGPRMLLSLLLLDVAALLLVTAGGCYTGPETGLTSPANDPTSAAAPAGPAEGAGGDAASLAASGIPCDVASLLATSCTDCHGAMPSEGAPVSLVTYEELAAPSKTDPTLSLAALAVDRLKDAKRPMPPDEAIPPSDVAALERWVIAGLPRNVGTCSGEPQRDGGGSSAVSADADAGAVDAAPEGATTCTSGMTWPAGASPSALMHPGAACLACHAQSSGPGLAIAGTVYPTLHEPNDCNGSFGPNLRVIIVDAEGKTHTLPVNEAGNFLRLTGLPVPYRATVTDGAKIREMKTPQTSGDCNGCHTEGGKLAPGRVMAP